jgi:pyruvate ferredoxin oxidoreductase gamma subunit
VIVQDPSLISSVDVAGGIKDDGLIIVNSEKKPGDIKIHTKATVKTLDATALALEVIGLPIVNTALLGAFAGATRAIRLESVNKAIRERFPGKVGDKNIAAVKRAYEQMEG